MTCGTPSAQARQPLDAQRAGVAARGRNAAGQPPYGLLTAGLAAATMMAGCSGGEPAHPAGLTLVAAAPHATVVRRCDQQHTGVGYGGLTGLASRQALHVGPLALSALGTFALDQLVPGYRRVKRYGPIESIAVIDAGATATVAISRPDRAFAGLLYDQRKFRDDGLYRVRDLDAVVRFEACSDRSFNHGVSQYDGGLVIAGRRCITILVYISGRARPETRRVPAKGTCP